MLRSLSFWLFLFSNIHLYSQNFPSKNDLSLLSMILFSSLSPWWSQHILFFFNIFTFSVISSDRTTVQFFNYSVCIFKKWVLKVKQRKTNAIWYHLHMESTKKDTNEFTYKTEQTQKTNSWLSKGINHKFGINRHYYT